MTDINLQDSQFKTALGSMLDKALAPNSKQADNEHALTEVLATFSRGMERPSLSGTPTYKEENISFGNDARIHLVHGTAPEQGSAKPMRTSTAETQPKESFAGYLQKPDHSLVPFNSAEEAAKGREQMAASRVVEEQQWSIYPNGTSLSRTVNNDLAPPNKQFIRSAVEVATSPTGAVFTADSRFKDNIRVKETFTTQSPDKVVETETRDWNHSSMMHTNLVRTTGVGFEHTNQPNKGFTEVLTADNRFGGKDQVIAVNQPACTETNGVQATLFGAYTVNHTYVKEVSRTEPGTQTPEQRRSFEIPTYDMANLPKCPG